MTGSSLVRNAVYAWSLRSSKVNVGAFAYVELLVCTLIRIYVSQYAMGNPRLTGFDVS